MTEKMKTKKVVREQSGSISFYYCPHCGQLLGSSIMALTYINCDECGGGLDWSETEFRP